MAKYMHTTKAGCREPWKPSTMLVKQQQPYSRFGASGNAACVWVCWKRKSVSAGRMASRSYQKSPYTIENAFNVGYGKRRGERSKKQFKHIFNQDPSVASGDSNHKREKIILKLQIYSHIDDDDDNDVTIASTFYPIVFLYLSLALWKLSFWLWLLFCHHFRHWPQSFGLSSGWIVHHFGRRKHSFITTSILQRGLEAFSI